MPVLDNFNRANAGPQPSAQWSLFYGSAGEGNVVLGNMMARKATGGFRQGSYWNAATYAGDVEISGTIGQNTAGANDGVYFFISSSGTEATASYYSFGLQHDGTSMHWVLDIYNAGSYVGNAFDTVAVNPVATDQILCRRVGTNLQMWRRTAAGASTLINQATSSVFTGTATLAVEFVNSQNIRLDDFGGGFVSSIPARDSRVTGISLPSSNIAYDTRILGLPPRGSAKRYASRIQTAYRYFPGNKW